MLLALPSLQFCIMFDLDAHVRQAGAELGPPSRSTSLFGILDEDRPDKRDVRDLLRGTLDAALRKRAELFAQGATGTGKGDGWDVTRRTPDGREPVEEDHPWRRVLERPNNFRSSYDFYYALRLIADCYGTFSMLVDENEIGVPETLLEIYPEFGEMRPKMNENGGIAGYVYNRADGERPEFDLEEVIDIRRIDQNTPYESTSIIESLIHEVHSDFHATAYRKRTYKEGRPPVVQLTTEKDIGKENAKKQGETFKDIYFGDDVKGVPVLYGGMEASSLALNPDDYQMLDSQALDQKVISRVTGIHLALLDQGSNRKEAKQARATVLMGTIQPLLNQAAGQMTLGFQQAFGSEPGDLRIEAPDVTPVDQVEEEEIRAKRIARGVPRATIMQENGEEIPEEHEEDLETPLRPNSLVPIDMMPATPARIAPVDGKPPDGDRSAYDFL